MDDEGPGGAAPVVVVHDLGDHLPAVTALLRRAADGGRRGLSESKERALRHALAGPPDGSPADIVVAAALVPGPAPPAAGELDGYGRFDGAGRLNGYGQLDVGADRRRYAVEVVVDPAADRPEDVFDAIVAALVSDVAGHGGGALALWAHRAGPTDDARAARHGFEPERSLLQLRCPLPVLGPASDGPPTRAFVPGQDEEAWLRVDDRAFAGHPEQGGWGPATLREREHEPWFDPEGLRVLELDGEMVGTCWTKVHRDAEPPLGEIYVIGVDPSAQGRGLGRVLTRAGLDWLAGRGLTVGMLYVDEANRTAVALYRSLGFVEDHRDRVYHLDVRGP